MKRKIHERIDRAARHKKSRFPVGGKALQRLFAYLGQRDPNLNNDVLAMIAVPVSERPEASAGWRWGRWDLGKPGHGRDMGAAQRPVAVAGDWSRHIRSERTASRLRRERRRQLLF